MDKNSLKGYVNHSGGALGADTAWGEEGSKYGVVSRHYYFGEKTPSGNVRLDLNDEDLVSECDREYEKAAKTLGRNPAKNPFSRNLLRRNWIQVKNSEEIFAIGKWDTPDPDCVYVSGGTGYAVEMALDHGKKVNFFEQEREGDPSFKGQWWKMECVDDGIDIEPMGSAPVLTRNFAGIGTRKINANGLRAIRDCYIATLSKISGDR